MQIEESPLQARAFALIVHERPVYDAELGLWVPQKLSEERVGNLITDAGRVVIHTYIYGLAADRVSANLGTDGLSYIGLSNNAGAPNAGDTTLTGELSGNGLDRAQGVVVLPIGAGTITSVSNQFTYTGGGSQQIQKTALFDDGTVGNMAHELLFTQRTLNTNDTITITFQITLT